MRVFLSFLLILFSCNAGQITEQKIHSNDHNPQLCYDFFRNLTNSSYVGPNVSVEVNNFLLFSGHNINDLGDYNTCNQLDTQLYTVGTVTGGGSTYSIGLCGPTYCNLTDLQNYANNLLEFISDMSELDLSSYSISFVDPNAIKPHGGFWLYFAMLTFGALFVMTVWGTILANRKETVITPVDENQAESQPQPENRQHRIISVNPLMINRDNDTNSERTSTFRTDIRTESIAVSAFRPRLPEIQSVNDENDIPFGQILECFDLVRNYKDFINAETNPNQDQNLNIFNGIRLIAFFYIVYGHSFMYTTVIVKNYLYVPEFMQSPWLLTVFGSMYSVDIFFYLAGFLSGMLLLYKLQAAPLTFTGYFQLLFHRLTRLWPAYCLAILFYWKLAVQIGSGPLWNNFVTKAEYCSTSAWQNLLFMDNVLEKDYECFSWGWYLACDLQIFLLFPLICWIYLKNKERGGYTILGLVVVSVIASYIYLVKTGVHFFPISVIQGKDTTKYMADFYPNPVVRMSTSLVGLWFGILFKEYKEGEVNLFTWIKGSQKRSVGCFFAGIIMLLYLIFFPRTLQNGGAWSNGFAMTWSTIGRLAWAVGLFLVTAPCLVGNMSSVRNFLGCKLFIVLSKVSYGGYLLHLVFLQMVVYGNNQYYSLSEGHQSRLALFIIMLSLAGGVILQLLIEKPIVNIEAKLMRIEVQRKEREGRRNKRVPSVDKMSVLSDQYRPPNTFHGAT